MNFFVLALRWICAQGLNAVFILAKMQIRGELSRANDGRSVIDDLSHSFDDGAIVKRGAKIVFLRKLLKRFPFWTKGHLELAQLAFLQRDIPLAYSSTLAVEKLSPRGKLRDRALLVRARCRLHSLDYTDAIAILNQLLSSAAVNRILVLEELGAALLAYGNEDEALRILESIPNASRTPSCQSALEYLGRQKNEGIN